MKTLLMLAILAPAALAQSIAAGPDCVDAAAAVNDLVQYCEVRDAQVWYDGTPLKIENEPNGGITVVPWDEPSVQVRAQVIAGAETWGAAYATAMQVEVDTSNGAVVVRGPRIEPRRAWTVRLHIRVPRTASLVLRTVNGSISVDDVEGSVSVAVVNGSVTLTRVAGDVLVRSVNGGVRVGVSRWRSQTIEVQSTNGGIEIDLPPDATARATLSLTVGTIHAAIGGSTWTSSGFGKTASFDIGGGGSAVRVQLVAGSIRLRVPAAADSEID